MNLPVSKPMVTNVFLDMIEPDKLLLDLNQKFFTGFLYLVANTEYHFEENIIFILKGNIIGSIYLNSFYNIELFGKTALNLNFNSLGYKKGVLNIYELSSEQLKLVLIFNDKIKCDYKLNKKKISKQTFVFNPALFGSILRNKFPDRIKAKSDLFDEFNINELLRY
jgi:hypothetical protein